MDTTTKTLIGRRAQAVTDDPKMINADEETQVVVYKCPTPPTPRASRQLQRQDSSCSALVAVGVVSIFLLFSFGICALMAWPLWIIFHIIFPTVHMPYIAFLFLFYLIGLATKK